jgi:hypothetical protein
MWIARRIRAAFSGFLKYMFRRYVRFFSVTNLDRPKPVEVQRQKTTYGKARVAGDRCHRETLRDRFN